VKFITNKFHFDFQHCLQAGGYDAYLQATAEELSVLHLMNWQMLYAPDYY